MQRQYWFPEHYASAVQRLRVPLGFALIAAFLVAAEPSRWSMILGLPFAGAGLGIRAWAAGHLEKNQQLAEAGPYAYVRNPLFHNTRATPNDLKLSEPRGWRDRCVVGKGGGRKQRA